MESQITEVLQGSFSPGSSASPAGAVSQEPVTSSDIAFFERSLQGASSVDSTETTAKVIFEPLEKINNEAQILNDYASGILADGGEMTPSDILTLTVKSQEFMFHSQLTANVANRSADGVQQLFRQQS